MKSDQIKKGQLVKLSQDSNRWSSFVDIEQFGIVLDKTDKGLVKVLFTDGELQEHWYFSLESIDENR